MEARLQKARDIVAGNTIKAGHGCYFVPSQTSTVKYRVTLDGLFPSCTCEDFELTNEPCNDICRLMFPIFNLVGQGRPARPTFTSGERPPV
jgi:hypothetical protein